MKVSSIRWGVIWIGLGLFFLLVNLELLDSLVFPRLFSLWPILLIAIGVELIFRKTRLYFLALVSPLLIAGAFVVAATEQGGWHLGANEFWRNWEWRFGEKQADIAEIAPDSTVRSLDIDLDCGSSRISLTSTSDRLFRASATYYRRSPTVKQTISDGVERIEYLMREKGWSGFFGLHLTPASSNFEIADYLPLTMTITTRDFSPDLDFSHLNLISLRMNMRASHATLDLGTLADSVNVTISGKAGDLRVTVPENFGLAISGNRHELEELLRKYDLEPSADGFYSSGFDETGRHARLVLEGDVKSLIISRD